MCPERATCGIHQLARNKKDHLKKVASEISKQVGVPDIRDKKPVETSGGNGSDDYDEEIIEFLPIYKRHSGAIIGKDGDTMKNLQMISGAKVSVIDFVHQDTKRSGALVSGDRAERYKAKCQIAVIIKQKDDELQKNPDSDKPKPRPQKRQQMPNIANPWMKKKKR